MTRILSLPMNAWEDDLDWNNVLDENEEGHQTSEAYLHHKP